MTFRTLHKIRKNQGRPTRRLASGAVSPEIPQGKLPCLQNLFEKVGKIHEEFIIILKQRVNI
jgi:hypothetical protein